MSRPAGSIPQWSSDSAYPVSTDPWSATATKVDPGAVVNSGAVPKTRLPAQFFNWILNRLSLFLIAYDAINIQNFTNLGTILGAVATVNPGNPFITTDPTTGQIWLVGIGGGVAAVIRSYNGVDWVNETANLPAASPNGVSIAFSSIDGFMWYAGNTTDVVSRTNVGVWAKITMPSSTQVNLVGFKATEPLPFIFGGESNSSHPAIWRGDETLGSMVSASLSGVGGYTGQIVSIAIGATRTVAFALCSAPVAEVRQWDVDTWSNVWTDRGAVPFGAFVDPTGLAYGSADNVFLATTNAGTVYVSSNGTTWALQATLAGVVFESGCLTVYGAIWATIGVLDSTRWIFWSVDAGVTWNKTPFPDAQASRVGATFALGLDCVYLVTSSGAGATPKLSVSLRAR